MFVLTKKPGNGQRSPDHKRLVLSNCRSVARLSHVANSSILLICPGFDKPGFGLEKQIWFFLLCIKINPNVERFICAVASKDQFRLFSYDQRHPSNQKHLLLVFLAELSPLELHHHWQRGVVDRELGGDGDVVLLVRGVHKPDPFRWEGNLLARGSNAGIKSARNPSLVPATFRHQFFI